MSYTFETLLDTTKIKLYEILNEVDNLSITDSNYEQAKRTKKRFENALKEATTGNIYSREIVISIYKDIISKLLVDLDAIHKVINFKNVYSLSNNIKFEILMYLLKEKHGLKCMNYIFSTYPKVHELREIEPNVVKREFSEELLNEILVTEFPKLNLSYENCLDILSILVYQALRGFGCIDTLLTNKIDGLEIGTSGTLRKEIDNNLSATITMTNSVWIQCQSGWTHLPFLDLGSVGEMRRVINQLISFGNTPSLSEANPTVINELWDGSRVVGIRPSVGECWSVFIRKFSIENPSLDFLLNKGEATKNWEMVKEHLILLMRSNVNIAFTGGQNTGKTTIMKTCIGFIQDRNIRVLEKSFETHLRELYPNMNTFTVKSNQYRTTSDLQDLLKKTDSNISIIGEVADDESAAKAIQFGKVGADRTFWTSHHKTNFTLVTGFADSLVASGTFKDYASAISASLEVIEINVHMARVNNQRVVSHISQIIEIPREQEYQELTKSNNPTEAIDSMNKLNREYYTRLTDRPRFKSIDIIRYNPTTSTYEVNDFYSKEILEKIKTSLSAEERKQFVEHYRKYWKSGDMG